MRFADLHAFDLTPREAVALQREFAGLVTRRADRRRRPRFIGGVDVSYERGEKRFFAGIVVYDTVARQAVARAGAVRESPFPYVPGLLSFREGPAVLDAARALAPDVAVDALIFDGHGLAHPRRFGLACHLGLWLGVPSVGCAKSLLVGEHGAVGPARGDRAPLSHRGEVIGAALRTRAGTRPVYVSVGHLMDLETAIDLVLRAGGGRRLPEPTRLAHQYVNEMRRAAASGRMAP
ncbi:MAG: endonuclease V [Planctomycetes bacterium]|nr:endonuclease V [Planctomycetota bacterium]